MENSAVKRCSFSRAIWTTEQRDAMSRCRLRSSNGCAQCRSRRKKCDETKPVCQACHRLRLACSWKSSDNPIRPSLNAQSTMINPTPLSSIAHSPSLRVPDFVSARKSDEVEIANLKGFIEDATVRDLSVHDRDLRSLQHFVIQGVRQGWHNSLDHPEVDRMTRLDRHIETCGHGQAARIAFFWLFLMLQAVLIPCSLSQVMLTLSVFPTVASWRRVGMVWASVLVYPPVSTPLTVCCGAMTQHVKTAANISTHRSTRVSPFYCLVSICSSSNEGRCLT